MLLCKKSIGGELPGAFVREELAVVSYMPQHVLPHVHAIANTDAITPNLERILASFMSGYRTDEGETIDLEPNIKWSVIGTAKELNDKFYYSLKAVNLVIPYQSFFNQIPFAPEASIRNLNRTCRDFIESYLEGIYNKTQVHYFGNLQPNAKSFLGTKTAKQMKREKKVKKQKARKSTKTSPS